jgi:hypothetical protein
MRKIGVLVAVVALGAALAGCSGEDKGPKTLATVTSQASSVTPTAVTPTTPATSKPAGKEFTSPDGYSFVPPTGWKNYPAGAGGGISVMFIAPGLDKAAKFSDNINVVVNANKQDLKTTISQTKLGLPTVLTKYRVKVDEPITAGDQQAHLLGGTFDQGTFHLQNLQLFFIVDGQQYTATFTCPEASFAKLRAQAQASMLTLRAA